MAPHGFVKPACGAIVSEDLRGLSFWTPAVVLTFCCSVGSLYRSGQSQIYNRACWTKFSTQKMWILHFFVVAQNGCLIIITLLRGPKIIIWSCVLCQVHHPIKVAIRDAFRDLGLEPTPLVRDLEGPAETVQKQKQFSSSGRARRTPHSYQLPCSCQYCWLGS